MKRRGRRSASNLPRYVLPKRLSSGVLAYFFSVPGWARKAGFQYPSEPLGTDRLAAISRAENILLPAFDSWRTNGKTDIGKKKVGVIEGTLDWMFHEYRKTWNTPTAKRRKPLSLGQQRNHEDGIRLVADHVLKDGTRLGAKRLTFFDSAVVDDLFTKLLFKTDKNGKQFERRTTVNHAMKTCRSAWNTVGRANPGKVGLNPFAQMGLVNPDEQESIPATYDELVAFRTKAVELGHQSIATGVLMSWHLLQRPDHVFKHFEVNHYRPAQYPDRICVVSPKTSSFIWSPLFNENGEPLFPDLIAELDRMKRGRPTGGLMLRRDDSGRNWATKGELLTTLSRVVKRIVKAAKLREEITLRSFRHGGFTEAAAAGLTDRQIVAQAQHTTPKNLKNYVHADDEIIISGQEMRQATRTKRAQKQGGLSE